MPRDEDILKRRARFISAAAILAAGCSRDQSTSKPVAVPSTESKPTASAPAETKPPPPVKAPADRPPLDPKVSTAGQAKRADAAARIEKVNAAVEQAAAAIPAGCPLHDPACRARFKVFHDDLAKLRDDVYDLHLVRCPPKTPDDKAVEDMLQAHQAWLYRWIDDIEKAGRAAADAHDDAGSVWDELHKEAAAAHPHPCLKFACP